MDGTDCVLILIAYVVAAAIKGFTGIGFLTACLPIMALQLDLKVAIPLVIIPSIISNIAVMIHARCFREAIGEADDCDYPSENLLPYHAPDINKISVCG